MANKTWTVFAPGQSKVVVKWEGKYYFYHHGDILTDKDYEPFFGLYARIFKEITAPPAPEPVEEVRDLRPPKKAPVVEVPIKDEPVAFEPEEDEPEVETVDESIEAATADLELEEVTKGWYIVTENGTQVFPETEGKKCRKKAAEQYIEENS